MGAIFAGRTLALGIAFILLVYCSADAVPLFIDDNIDLICENTAGDDGEFTFAVLGDSQSIDIVYLPILAQIKEDKPAFILHTGDLTFGGSVREFEHYKEVLGDYPIPIVHVIGNHDVMQDKDNYVCYVGDFNWSFDFGGCRFIGLDNSAGAFTADSIEFAACALEQDAPAFVAFHHPPHFKDWEIHAMLPDTDGGNGNQLMHLLEPANVQAVFCGHLHLHDKKTINGIPYIISGCGGARLYKFGFGLTEYGYVLVNVSNYGKDVEFSWVPLRDSPFN